MDDFGDSFGDNSDVDLTDQAHVSAPDVSPPDQSPADIVNPDGPPSTTPGSVSTSDNVRSQDSGVAYPDAGVSGSADFSKLTELDTNTLVKVGGDVILAGLKS